MLKPCLGRHLLIIGLIAANCSCHDPALEKPDGFGHGYNLTHLGSLLYRPWFYNKTLDGFNVKLYYDDSVLYSKPGYYSPIQRNVTFKLNRDGSATYWFKNENSNAGNKYSNGSWDADFKDSSLTISLGQGPDSVIIKGKYLTLGSNAFSVAQEMLFDTIVNGQNLKCKKVTTVYFEN